MDEFGVVRSLSVTCLSEVAWHDTARMKQDIVDSGGFDIDQYDVQWSAGNAAGVTVLLEATGVDGNTRSFLMDCGWAPEYVSEVYRREGIDQKIASGEVEFLFITHEHMDHFWGVSAVVALRPDIRIILPAGISERSRDLLRSSGHTGEVVEMAPGSHILFPGCTSVTFDVPINLRARNEQALYFNVEEKGIVTVTGCCHLGATTLLDFARERFPGTAIHAVYGGLHLAPFDEWGEKQEQMLGKLCGYGVERWACNHCTGILAVQHMLKKGMNVVGGTGRHGSKSDLYIGNGDRIVF